MGSAPGLFWMPLFGGAVTTEVLGLCFGCALTTAFILFSLSTGWRDSARSPHATPAGYVDDFTVAGKHPPGITKDNKISVIEPL